MVVVKAGMLSNEACIQPGPLHQGRDGLVGGLAMGWTRGSLAAMEAAEKQQSLLQGQSAELQAEVQRRQEEMEQVKAQLEAEQSSVAAMRQQLEEMEKAMAAAAAEHERQLEIATAGLEGKLHEESRPPLLSSIPLSSQPPP